MKIVLPQVIKRILPAMGNEVITLVKDTSLAFVPVSYTHLFWVQDPEAAMALNGMPLVQMAVNNAVGEVGIHLSLIHISSLSLAAAKSGRIWLASC